MGNMLAELIDMMPDKELPLQTKLQRELEFLGYISYTDPSRPTTAVIMDINTKYSTLKVTIYCIGTGETKVVKLKKKLYEQNPFAVGYIINYRLEQKPGWRKDEQGAWQIDYSKTDTWLQNYCVESYS